MDNKGTITLEQIESCLPENPYPEDIFPMTIKEYAKIIPDSMKRTSISGCIARWQFDVAKQMIMEGIKNQIEANYEQAN